eukprot:c21335_g3_i1 orf=1-219(-)
MHQSSPYGFSLADRYVIPGNKKLVEYSLSSSGNIGIATQDTLDSCWKLSLEVMSSFVASNSHMHTGNAGNHDL